MRTLKAVAFLVAVGLSGGLIVDVTRGGSIPELDSEGLSKVWGGTCYGDATTTCGDSAVACPTHDCERDTGTLDYTCYKEATNGANQAKLTEQPSYSHYVSSSAGKSDLTDETTEDCNKFYTCGCDDSALETDPQAIPVCSGDSEYRSSHSDTPTTFSNQTPTGDTCPAGG